MGITPSGRLVTQNSAGDQGIGSTNIALDEWVHVVWTYDGENDRASIYLNGEPEVEDDPQAPNGTGNLKVGSGRSGGLNFIGLLDDVAVWDSLLTRAEIALLAEGASPVGQETVLPSGLGYTLSGRVQTPDGVPAVGATVRATPIGAETITDGEGRFSFTELSPSDGAISLFANFTDGGNTTWSGFCPRVRRDEGDIGNLFCAIILTEGTPLAKVYEFSEVGVLPDSDEGEFFNNSGSPTSSVFTVENGFLEQRTFEINGNVTYFYPSASDLGAGDIDPSRDVVMEVRLRILGTPAQSRLNGWGGAFFEVTNGTHRYPIGFVPTGFDTSPNEDPLGLVTGIDIHGLYTYRIESPADSDRFTVFQDGRLVFSGVAAPDTRYNHFSFGDGKSPAGNGADVSWDYVMVHQFPGRLTPLTMPQLAPTVSYGGDLSQGRIFLAPGEGSRTP